MGDPTGEGQPWKVSSRRTANLGHPIALYVCLPGLLQYFFDPGPRGCSFACRDARLIHKSAVHIHNIILAVSLQIAQISF